jgi:hypothetical protein
MYEVTEERRKELDAAPAFARNSIELAYVFGSLYEKLWKKLPGYATINAMIQMIDGKLDALPEVFELISAIKERQGIPREEIRSAIFIAFIEFNRITIEPWMKSKAKEHGKVFGIKEEVNEG